MSIKSTIISVSSMILFFTLLTASLQTAAAQKVSVGSYEVESGTTFTVSVIVYNITNIAGIDVALSYNPTVVNVQGYQLNKIFADCFNFDNIDNSKGLSRIIVVCADGINAQSLNAINFTFKAVGNPGDKTELKISANFSDTSFKLVTPETVDGYVKILGEESESGVTPTQPVSSGSGSCSSSATPTTKTTTETKNAESTETGEAVRVSETPLETPQEKSEMNENKSQNMQQLTPVQTLTTPIFNKTLGKSEVAKQGPFKIPGFEILLTLFAVSLVWRLRK